MHDADAPDTKTTPTPATDGGSKNSYKLLRNRDFLYYLIGRFISSLGQQMLIMTVGWELYERTQSALMLGYMGLTLMVPMILFTLPAGHVADNFNRKRIIELMTIVVAGASIALAFISAAHADVFWIYLCLFVLGASRTFLWAASASFLPQLVDRKDLSHAVNLNSGTFQVSAIAGPAAAGALIAWTGHATSIYVLNAVAALLCCGLVLLVRHTHVVAKREEMTLKNLLTGFRFVFSTRIISGIITLDMLAVFLGGAVALLPIFAKDILNVGPSGLGLLRAAMPLGAVLCSAIMAHRPPLQKAGRSLLWAVAAFGLATIGFGFSHMFWLSFVMLFICGAVDNVSVLVRHTLVQLLTPDEKRGRVSAVNNLFIGTSNEMGEFESGTVAHVFGPVIGNTIATGAIISAVTGGIGTILTVFAVALIWPEIRKYGRLDGSH